MLAVGSQITWDCGVGVSVVFSCRCTGSDAVEQPGAERGCCFED